MKLFLSLAACVSLLPLVQPADAQPMPITLTGIVYEADGVTQVPSGTPVIIDNVDNGSQVELLTSGPPPVPGNYLVDLSDANGGDTVIVSSFTATHEGSTTVVLGEAPSTTTADVILDQLRQDPVPTVSAWGIIVMGLSLLATAAVLIRQRRQLDV